MLKMYLPTMIIMMPLASKYFWWSATSVLMLLTTTSMTTLKPYLVSITNLTMVDPMSSCLIILSTLIASLMMMTSTKILHTSSNYNLFITMNILLLFILINCFSASNLFNFYIWFEASLIPTMIIIMIWGYQPERVQASMYMMIYTILASLPMLLMFFMTYKSSNTPMINLLMFSNQSQTSLMSLFMISGFLVKLPMFTVHLWLPKAHVEAPIAGSMVLAAILLKLGGYGIMRMLMSMPSLTTNLMASLCSLSLIGGILTSMVCMRQSDLKSMIAYSSVGHMGLMLSGILSNSQWGMMGSMLMMVAHGLTSSALFSLANLTYEMSHTRSLFLMKGMLSSYPTLSMWWFMFCALNMAAPPSINLMSEIMLMTAIMSIALSLMLPLMIMSFVTGAYSLYMYTSTQHGHMNNFENYGPTLKSKDMLMLSMHMIPAIMLIVKTESMITWM